MSILDMIEIVQGDITQYPSDLMILKYADGNHGADLAVAQAIGFQHHVPAGELWFQPGEGTASKEVIFLGVGSLFDFRYDAIRDFGRRLIMTAVERPTAKTITTTIHGPGYGLDEVESFRSEVLGQTRWAFRCLRCWNGLRLLNIPRRGSGACSAYWRHCATT